MAEEKIDYTAKIKRLFPLSGRDFYPVRPVFSLVVGIVGCVFGFFDNAFANLMFIGAIGGIADDVLFAPYMALKGYLRNLWLGRKVLKSSLSLLFITVATVLAGLGAYFFLAHMPFMLNLTQTVMDCLETSVVLFSIAVGAGALLSKLLGQDTFLGGVIGSLVAHSDLVPMAITSLPLNLVLGAVLVTAFTSLIVVKHSLRAVYKLRYGHTNADGYEYMVGDSQYSQSRRKNLAEYYEADEKHFNKLVKVLTRAPQVISDRMSFFGHFLGIKTQYSSGYKDMLYVMANVSNSEIKQAKEGNVAAAEKKTLRKAALKEQLGVVYESDRSKIFRIGTPATRDLFDTNTKPQIVAFMAVGNEFHDDSVVKLALKKMFLPMWTTVFNSKHACIYRENWFKESVQGGLTFFPENEAEAKALPKIYGEAIETQATMRNDFVDAIEAMQWVAPAS